MMHAKKALGTSIRRNHCYDFKNSIQLTAFNRTVNTEIVTQTQYLHSKIIRSHIYPLI